MRGFRIGSLRIETPFVLAPMAGFTHAAFRELVAFFGGCGLYCTEMLNSRVVATQNPAKDAFCRVGTGDRPLAAQIAGSDPETVAKAAERLQGLGRFHVLDFNLGCPRGAVQRHGWGAALMERPDQVVAVLKACRSVAALPLTVKTRIPRAGDGSLAGWVKFLEANHIDGLVLHARTPADLFKRPARWNAVARAKRAASVPVIGNGDVFGPAEAVRMMAETGCDGVMIGRAALLRPWIFRDCCWFLESGVIPEPPDPVQVVRRYARLIEAHLPENLRLSRFRSFCFWYLQNFPYGGSYFGRVNRRKTLDGALETVMNLVGGETFPPYPRGPVSMR